MSAFPYEIFLRGENGALRAAHVVDTSGGDARPLTAEDLALLAPDINVALLATIQEQAAQIAALQIELATRPAASATPLLTRLGEIYANLPVEVQDAFLGEFSILRNALQAGLTDNAKRRLAAIDLPESLESTRAEMLALFP